jgi:hypothetical protein
MLRFELHARGFGCPVVGAETGSLDPDCSCHTETRSQTTFDGLCGSVERPVRVAEACGSIVGIETGRAKGKVGIKD